jgi:CubicO group peptidase (beta-lactamase class C family)
MEEVIRTGLTPGAVVGISEKRKITFLKGYGLANVEHEAPVIAETVFRTGSMIKQFTSACILLLAEQKKLSIEDRLAEHLPDFPGATDVSLRQLLNHTSGIRDYVGEGFIGGNPSRIERTKDELIQYIASLDKLHEFEPGTAFEYSNSNYILLGAVIEKVSGESYAAFLKKNIFDPLGLNHTALDDAAEIVPNRAAGYRRGASPGAFRNVEFLPASNLWAAGGLRSTAADLLKWEDALLDGKLLSPKSVALMMTQTRLKDGSLADKLSDGRKLPFLYGLGAIASEPVAGRAAMGNGGFIPGFQTWVRRLPKEGITMVVLVNMTGGAREIATKLVPAIFEAAETTDK